MMFLIINFSVVAADIITKKAAVTALNENDIQIIRNVLYLSYVENKGAAFGMLSNARIVFIAVTVITVAAIFIYVFYKKPKFKLFVIGLAMVSGGGIGNLADRIFKGYVVDFIDFRIIRFPVFNFADVCVTVGAILIFIAVMFFEDRIK